jgi:hypothetical protein
LLLSAGSLAAQFGLVPIGPMVALPAGRRLAGEQMVGFPAQGVELHAFNGTWQGVPLRAWCVAWDPSSPRVEFKPVLAPAARTPTQFAALEPGGAWIAVNGGYFGANQSYSLVQQGGLVLAPNIKALTRPYQGTNTTYYPTRAAFGLSAFGRPVVDWIYHVGSGNAAIFAYPAPSPNQLNAAPQPVPSASFPAGAVPWVMQHAVGGSPMLVREGEVRLTDQEELIDVNNTQRRPRTAIGYTATGLVLLLAVEGDNAPAAPGLTLLELARLMQSVGAVGAINLDGGGSTSISVAGRTLLQPSDGSERPVVSALLWRDPLRTGAAPEVPRVVASPPSATVLAGGVLTLPAVVAGGEMNWQWLRQGRPLAGATDPALTFAAVTAADAGEYSLVATNARGTVTTAPATVRIVSAPRGRLGNLSVRAWAGAGEDALVAGFVAREGGKSLLARGVGPGLTAFGVLGLLVDPRLELTRADGQVLAGNDNWEDAAGPVAARLGAFALPVGSRDAALLRTVDAGAFTLTATPVAGTAAGNMLVEVYDDGGAGSLVNLSARARVGRGTDLIAGFVVTGSTAVTVLVRAVGPGLRAFGLSNPLALPRITLMRDGAVVSVNAGWAAAPNALDQREAARRTGAFALVPGLVDAALLVTLDPGAYSAVVDATDGGAGVALVEVYEVR